MPDSSPPAPTRRPHLLGWRLVALVYDFFPALGLWFLVILAMLALNRGQAIQDGSAMAWVERLALLGITGLYATASWRRGGQTIGMKPWRLYVDGADGQPASWSKLWIRYGVGLLSLAAAGAGFWWALVDRDRLTWHDRASGTRLVRDMERDAALAPRND